MVCKYFNIAFSVNAGVLKFYCFHFYFSLRITTNQKCMEKQISKRKLPKLASWRQLTKADKTLVFNAPSSAVTKVGRSSTIDFLNTSNKLVTKSADAWPKTALSLDVQDTAYTSPLEGAIGYTVNFHPHLNKTKHLSLSIMEEKDFNKF